MLRAKKKITKRELKQDALVTTLGKAESLYEENKRLIGIVAAAIAVAVVGVMLLSRSRASAEEAAGAALGRVREFVDNGQHQVAVEGVKERGIMGLREIVDEYGSTSSGRIARFYLANAYFATGKVDDALREFEDVDPIDDLVASSRLAGIAACREAKRDHAGAAESFERAGTAYPKDPSAAENLWHAARNHAQAGNRERALDLLRKVKKNSPESPLARDADRLIEQYSR